MDPIGIAATDYGQSVQEAWPERALTAFAMGCILLLCAIVTVTVISRWLYKPLIPDDVLIVRELMVAIILFPLASVTAARAHIAVTVFTHRLGKRGHNLLSVFGYLVGTFFAGALIWAGVRLFQSAWTSGEYFDGDIYIPAWIGYAVFVVALAAFACRMVVQPIRDVVRAVPD